MDTYICIMTSEPRKKLFTFKRLINAVYIGVLLLLLFNPAAKALLIKTLMRIGFFQPDVTLVAKPPSAGRLPAVIFADKAGNTLQLTSLQGKVVFVNFWATWCAPCLAEMPGISQLYNRFKNNSNVVFIMVDVDQQLNKSDLFLQKHDWDLPLYQSAGGLPRTLSSKSIPFTAIFNRNGNMVYRHEGTADYSSNKMVAFIERLSH